jgi:hypothetical protein
MNATRPLSHVGITNLLQLVDHSIGDCVGIKCGRRKTLLVVVLYV